MRISKETLSILRQYDAGAEKAWLNWLSLEKNGKEHICATGHEYTGFGVWVAGYWHPFTNQFVTALEAEPNNEQAQEKEAAQAFTSIV